MISRAPHGRLGPRRPARPSVWAHGYVQVFGFMALFIMGVAYHVLLASSAARCKAYSSFRWSFWLQVVASSRLPAASFMTAPATRPFWIAGSTSLVIAAVLLQSYSRTLRAGLPRANRSAAGSPPARLAGRGFGACDDGAITGDVTWHRVLWTAATVRLHQLLDLRRRPPHTADLPRCQPRWPDLERPVFVAYQVGAAAWVAGAWPNPDSLLCSMSCAPPERSCSHLGHGLYRRSRVVRAAGPGPRMRGAQPSKRVGELRVRRWSWLFVGLALGPGATFARMFSRRSRAFAGRRLRAPRAGLRVRGADDAWGVASRVVPNFTGNALWSPLARDVGFYLLNASMSSARSKSLAKGFGLGGRVEIHRMVGSAGGQAGDCFSRSTSS